MFNELKLINFNFPIIKSDNFIENTIYNTIKSNYPNFNDFRTTNAGQSFRNNIELKKTNKYNYNYLKIHKSYQNLYNKLDSQEFRNLLKEKLNLNNEKHNKEIGYIGNFDSANLILHIAKSITGYENPWHVDTRKRIIHFLIYFGDEDIEEGGQIAIGEHSKLNKATDYLQYPEINNLTNIKYIEPKNNTAVFLLAQNNSYHKGCLLKGTRRFIYGGYTNVNGPAWHINTKWSNGYNFSQQMDTFRKSIKLNKT
jgi:hypothetical protein